VLPSFATLFTGQIGLDVDSHCQQQSQMDVVRSSFGLALGLSARKSHRRLCGTLRRRTGLVRGRTRTMDDCMCTRLSRYVASMDSTTITTTTTTKASAAATTATLIGPWTNQCSGGDSHATTTCIGVGRCTNAYDKQQPTHDDEQQQQQ
jgi:hypothetical protein